MARQVSTWKTSGNSPVIPGKRVQCQEYILWRRLAGGLTQQRQEQVLARELDKLRARKKVPPELIRLAGSLERLPVETKTDLAILFIDMATELAREKKHCAPCLAA